MKRRSAFTLVEMVMTMTMGGALMLLAIGLVHQSMSMSKLAKIRGEHDQTLGRLAQQFRSDVHKALELISVSTDLVSLRMADQSTVTYKRDGANVTWEKSGSGARLARELFRFDERCVATFAGQAATGQAAASQVVLQVERQIENSEVPTPIDLRVVAFIGRWKQLEQSGATLP